MENPDSKKKQRKKAMWLKKNNLVLKVPAELRDREPFMFSEWYKKNRMKRWIEYDRRNEDVIKLASPKPGKRILDVGCAWGYSAMRMSFLGVEAYGVDIDKDALDFGRVVAKYNRHEVKLKYANAKSLPFSDNFFDDIICVESLEHIPLEDRLKALGEMKRTLKKGGKIILSTPNPRGIAEMGKRIFGRMSFFREFFSASYRSQPRSYTFETGDRMVDILVTEKEVQAYARKLRLTVSMIRNIIFVLKVIPDLFFYPSVLAERVLESAPFFNELGCTKIYVLQK